jgi:hypothetical protein
MSLTQKQLINTILSGILFVYITSSIEPHNKYLIQNNNLQNNLSLKFMFFIFGSIIMLNCYSNKQKVLFIRDSIMLTLLFFLLTSNDTYKISNYLLDDISNDSLIIKGITIYGLIYFLLLVACVPHI